MTFTEPLFAVRKSAKLKKRQIRRKRKATPSLFGPASSISTFSVALFFNKTKRTAKKRSQRSRSAPNTLFGTSTGSSSGLSVALLFPHKRPLRLQARTVFGPNKKPNANYLILSGSPSGPGGIPMATKDLIDLSRAKFGIQSIIDASQDSLLSYLITNASDAIQKYCKRDFFARAYDEIYNGNGLPRLLLRQYPILSVESIRTNETIVLVIQNTDNVINQRANVAITSTGLNLLRVASGVKFSASVAFVPNPTLQSIATAIIALGAGWTASVISPYNLYPSADLYIPKTIGVGITSHGALNALNTNANLNLHVKELEEYRWDVRGWLIKTAPFTDDQYSPESNYPWDGGVNSYRVQYTAGYNPIPEAVQQACAEWTAIMYYKTQRDPANATQSIVGTLSQSFISEPPGSPPKSVAALLAPFVRTTIGNNQS